MGLTLILRKRHHMLLSKEHIDLLIIIPPAGIKNTVYPPYGAMYIASALRQKGYNPKILNVDTERIANRGVIERIKRLNPKYIGFSGIVAPSYRYIKELSLELREAVPDKIQILGGGLASAADPVMKNTSIDIIVQGEGDITIVELLDCLEKRGNLKEVGGIFYKTGSSYEYTGKRDLIRNLDTLPYPTFDIVDINRYMPDGTEFIRLFTTKIRDKRIDDPNRRRKMITIPTSRGCFNECSFCFRAYRGLRVHSISYVFDFIEYCIEKFNVGFFTFGDECFAPNKARNWEFIEEYKKRNSDIIFRILGMRVDTVDKEILRAYKEIGCWMIEYGFESGSQKMLNVIDKRVSVEQNRQAALWTNEAGIYTSPALVLGMPGETSETIRESIDFVKSLNFDFKQYQWTYALPIPGSHLYDFAKLTGTIEDEDEYLSSLADDVAGAGVFHVNLTDEPDEVVAGWDEKLKSELDNYYLNRKYKNHLMAKFMNLFEKIKLYYMRKKLLFILRAKIGLLISSTRSLKRRIKSSRITVRFKKKGNINFEDFLRGLNYSSPSREIALKKINQRLQYVSSANPTKGELEL